MQKILKLKFIKIFLIIQKMIQDYMEGHHQKKKIITTIKKGIFTSCKKMMIVLHGQLKLKKLNMIKIKNK